MSTQEKHFRLHRRRSPEEFRPYFHYDELSDTLLIYFYGQPESAVSDPVDDSPCLYLRLDPETDELVGLQIEAFLTRFIHDHPEFIDFLDMLDISEDRVASIDRSEARQRRPAAFATMMLGSMMMEKAELASSG